MRKTCFVVIGFGTKTDFETGRRINLDKTFENIIKPVFDAFDIFCYRSCDVGQSGVIDVEMYESIFKADFVVADISTLNPNALYELGVRHALRPNTTIVIAEDKLKLPFDVNHISTHFYKHLEADIGYSEVVRFQNHLKNLVQTVIDNPKTDSPVYTFLPKLKPPSFSDEEIQELENNIQRSSSTADLVELAETKKNAKEYPVAKALLEEALKTKPHDSFIIQRLALTVYKSKLPTASEALHEALTILEPLNPQNTTDPETLGLLGAIYKRLYDEEQQKEHLDRSLHFYERGYYIKQDYYNGINTAFLNLQLASLADAKFDIYAHYGQAKKIWKAIINNWNGVEDKAGFWEREDAIWIVLTLAEAYNGLENKERVTYYVNLAREQQIEFAIDSYEEQAGKIAAIKAKITLA